MLHMSCPKNSEVRGHWRTPKPYADGLLLRRQHQLDGHESVLARNSLQVPLKITIWYKHMAIVQSYPMSVLAYQKWCGIENNALSKAVSLWCIRIIKNHRFSAGHLTSLNPVRDHQGCTCQEDSKNAFQFANVSPWIPSPQYLICTPLEFRI